MLAHASSSSPVQGYPKQQWRGRLAYDWASALQTRKSNNASVCGCQTPRTARSHTRPHWSRSPLAVLASRTTGSDVTCEKAIDASWPVTSRISLWRSITLPPLGQFSPWSTENSAPQPSQTDGICTRGLWYRIATPSLNSLGDKAALFLMLGVTDSQAPIGWSAALRTARCLDSENDEMTSLRTAALPALRTIRCSLLAARTACRCVLRFTSTRPWMALLRWSVAFREVSKAARAVVVGSMMPRPANLTGRANSWVICIWVICWVICMYQQNGGDSKHCSQKSEALENYANCKPSKLVRFEHL